MKTVLDIRTVRDSFPGIGRYTYHLAREMVRRNGSGQLMLISNRPSSANTRFDIAALAEGRNVRVVYTQAHPFTAREQLLLPRELRKLSPTVSHFPYLVLPYAAPRPLVLTVHDIIPVRFPKYFTALQRLRYRICLSLAIRSAACVICVSEATRSDLKAAFRIDSGRLFVVHEGVADSFQPCSGDAWKRVKAALGLPEPYLLYLGSNKPHKNLPALIDAYARLSAVPSLVVAGMEDTRYPEARRRVDFLNLNDRVRFIGSVREADLPVLYGCARAFVFPSIYEGFGLPPLEAMACGTPVACSGIPSLREAVGGAALLFDPGDSASIASALERILQDEALRDRLRSRGFRRAAEASWTLAAQKTMDLYQLAAEMPQKRSG